MSDQGRLSTIRARAQESLAVLASGSEPWSDSGYGYEHMGDMARDLAPLAADVLVLCDIAEAAERYANLELRACDDPCECGSAECQLVLALSRLGSDGR